MREIKFARVEFKTQICDGPQFSLSLKDQFLAFAT